MVRKEKESNRLRNFIWIISGILLLGIFSFIGVYAGNTISNSASSYYVADNITLNNTGVYYKTTSDTQKLTKTADVVVCSGTSAIDDLIKSFYCDVVCKSSDNGVTCGTKINSSITTLSNAGGGLMAFDCGTFNNSIYIQPMSNVKITGHGACTILYLTAKDEYFRDGIGNINNFEISNLKFVSGYSGNTVGIGFDTYGAKNIYIHDIDFGNMSFNPFRVTGNNGGSNYNTNIIIERTRSTGKVVLGSIVRLRLSDNLFNETCSGCNTLVDAGYSESNNDVYDVVIEKNTFLKKINDSFCLALSGNTKDYVVRNNYFSCNGTIIQMSLDDASMNATGVIIEGNSFYGSADSTTGRVFVEVKQRSSRSYISVINNYFYDLGNKYYGVYTKVPALISGNYFYKLGYASVLGLAKVQFNNNILIDCSGQNAANKWVYLQATANHSVISNNQFIATTLNAQTLYNLENSFNNSIHDNRYFNFTGTLYTQTGQSINNSYIDDWTYDKIVGGVPCPSVMDGPLYNKIIYNTTAGCRCSGGAWKCWAMS